MNKQSNITNDNNENKKFKLLSPQNDYVFKLIFGRAKNVEITRAFLKAITGVEYKELILEQATILEKDLEDSKIGVLDIRAKGDDNTEIDIEMQVVSKDNLENRILWYESAMLYKSLISGDDYNKLHKAVSIMICAEPLEKLKYIPKFITRWQIREEEYQTAILTDKLEIDIIELDKLEKTMKSHKNYEELKAWCEFLKNPEKMEDKVLKEYSQIKQAKEELEVASQDERTRRLAELRDKALSDEKALLRTGYTKGKIEGIREGIQQGIQQGIQEGIQEGKNAGIKETKIETAKNMLKENIDIEIIVKITGLTKEEIEEIKEKHSN